MSRAFPSDSEKLHPVKDPGRNRGGKKKHPNRLPIDPQNARRTALAILSQIDRGKQTLDAIMTSVYGQIPTMTPRDRALTQTIVYGVLRWRRRLDAFIAHFSKIKLNRIDPIVRTILRMGMFQILFLDRIPDSAAVNTSVELTKAHAPVWVVRFVNGLLRQATRRHAHISIHDTKHSPVDALAIGKSFPSWLIRRWVDRFGLEETTALCDAINTIPGITIRANTLKCDRRQLVEALQPEVDNAIVTSHSKVGLHLNGLKRTIDQMSSFKAGFFQVQDEAAQMITSILNPQAGESILDACAGLGGKTGHMAQTMQNRGSIVAVDNSLIKLDLLEQEMNRLGVTCVTTQHIDWTQPEPQLPPLRFDRILLDAPCSGIGVMRRNPDIKWRSEKSNLMRYARRQRLLLSLMAPLLKSGGILVYAVCSFEPEENEYVVNGFLKNHSEFAKEGIVQMDLSETAGGGCKDGYLRTLPHHHAMDGFFAARLKKIQ